MYIGYLTTALMYHREALAICLNVVSMLTSVRLPGTFSLYSFIYSIFYILLDCDAVVMNT